MRTAILQVADQGPLESLAVMLRSAGYVCMTPGHDLREYLRTFGGLVLAPSDLNRSMGYDLPFAMPVATFADLQRCDLYVDIKAHQIHDRLITAVPQIAGRVLWYRINGGKPEHVKRTAIVASQETPYSPVVQSEVVVEDCGDEVNPPCPVLTPNQWYKNSRTVEAFCDGTKLEHWQGKQSDRAYVCWPPFYRFADYTAVRNPFDSPVCLIHNLNGWGYGRLIEPMRELGVRMLGRGSPDGLVEHRHVPQLLSTALAMVHLKSSDAPGYAIYEAMAAGCPIICTRRLIWRCRMQDLLEPGQTCLVFDRETHEGLTDADVAECTREVRDHLERLRDPAENQRIGENGRKRLLELQWNAARDGESLRNFLRRNIL